MPSFRFLPVLLAVLLFTGCQNQFTRLRATNFHDEVIAEWTARGRIVPLGRGGYRITAVERLTPKPYSTYTRYPDGWPTSVQGPHIWHWRCPKPAWLAELEDGLPPVSKAAAPPSRDPRQCSTEVRRNQQQPVPTGLPRQTSTDSRSR